MPLQNKGMKEVHEECVPDKRIVDACLLINIAERNGRKKRNLLTGFVEAFYLITGKSVQGMNGMLRGGNAAV